MTRSTCEKMWKPKTIKSDILQILNNLLSHLLQLAACRRSGQWSLAVHMLAFMGHSRQLNCPCARATRRLPCARLGSVCSPFQGELFGSVSRSSFLTRISRSTVGMTKYSHDMHFRIGPNQRCTCTANPIPALFSDATASKGAMQCHFY